MDTRRALLLLLVICTINAAFSTGNGDRPNNIRRVRRISEYLVPPPPPRFHPLNRIPRANYQSTKEPGYMARLISWMNPWWSTFTLPSPPPSTTTYIGPPPVDYEKPPPPSSNDNSGYPASKKTENCNACNTVPWMPLEQNQNLKDAFSLLRSSPQIGGYISKEPHPGEPYDTYHAASHEVKVSDFSFPTPLNAKDGSKNALPNPQLYFGGLPPLHKAENFNHSPQVTLENSEYLGTKSVSGNGAPTRNNSPLTRPVFNDGHNGQSVYPDSDLSGTGVVFQNSGYTNPNANNGEHFHQTHAPDGSFINASPNLQVHPGALPPLYKTENFNYSPQVIPNENSKYLGTTSVSGNGVPTRNNSLLTGPAFNDGYNGQSVYSDSDLSGTGVVFQESGYTNPNANNGEHFHQNHATPDGANSVPDKQGLENLHVYPGTLPPFFKEKTFNYSPQVTPDENSEYLGTTSVSGNGAPTRNNSPLIGPAFNDRQSVYPDSDILGTKVTFQNSGYTNPNANNGEHFHQNNTPNNSYINALPNPQVHPGALPPLHKVKDFNYSPQVTPDKNLEYLDTTSVSGNGVPTRNNSPLTGPAFNDGHNGQSVYPDSDLSGTGVVFQKSGYTNPNANNEEHFHQNHAISDDTNSVPDKEGLENLHVYPGPLPPFFKEKNFNYSPQVTPDENSKYLGTTSVSDVPTRNNFPLKVTDSAFNNGQSVYPDSDLSDKQELKDTNIDNLFASMNHQKFFNNYGILNDQASGEPANKEPYYTTRSNGSNNFLDGQANQNLPSYEISNLDRIPDYRRHNSRGPLPSDGSMNGNIEESIISPLQDLLLRDENRAHSSSLPPTFDAYANFKNATGIPDDMEETLNYDNTDVTPEQQDGKRKQVQVIIPYTSDYTPLPFHPSYEKNISDVDNYVSAESRNTVNVVKPPNSPIFQPQSTTLQPIFSVNKKPVPNNTKANNSIDPHKLQRNIDNWTIQKYSGGTTASTVSPIYWNNPYPKYLSPSKTIPKEYFTTTEPIDHVTNSYKDNVKTFTLAGFSFNDKEYNESANHHIEEPQVQVIEKIENLTKKSPIAAPITEKNMWQNFPLGISSVNKERVYIVTPQPQLTPRYSENRKQKTLKEAENNTKEVSDIKKMDTNKSDTFESIEKAYQVLPQAVNNLAVASTGPESAHLWGIMEHDDFASSVESVDSEYDSNNTKLPIYSRLSKESRARR